MWGVLGNAATVVKLVGFDAAGLIAKIRQAARTAQQNNKDCELLARRVDMLPRLMRPCGRWPGWTARCRRRTSSSQQSATSA
jgi:hypothetical protein